MSLKSLVRILLICGLFLTVFQADLFAQKRQSSGSDSLTSSRPIKSVASKSYAERSYDTKIPASYLQLKYARSYASEDQCSFATSKGLRCRRKAQAGSTYCRQHAQKYEPKERSDKSDLGKQK